MRDFIILDRLPYMTRIPENKIRNCYAYICPHRATYNFKQGNKTKQFPRGQQRSGTFCSFHALRLTTATKYEVWRFNKAMTQWEKDHPEVIEET